MNRLIESRVVREKFQDCLAYMGSEVKRIIDITPTVEAKPVVHGEWIDNGIQDSILSGCSVCGYSCGAYSMNFCPNCGADMRGGKND